MFNKPLSNLALAFSAFTACVRMKQPRSSMSALSPLTQKLWFEISSSASSFFTPGSSPLEYNSSCHRGPCT